MRRVTQRKRKSFFLFLSPFVWVDEIWNHLLRATRCVYGALCELLAARGCWICAPLGQGLVERKKRMLYAETQHLGGKRKNESSLEATRQRGRATIATEHVVMLPSTQVSRIK